MDSILLLCLHIIGESNARVIDIAGDANGLVDLSDLETQLKLFSDVPLKIGSFSAASNVTGLLEKVFFCSYPFITHC